MAQTESQLDLEGSGLCSGRLPGHVPDRCIHAPQQATKKTLHTLLSSCKSRFSPLENSRNHGDFRPRWPDVRFAPLLTVEPE